MKVRSWKYRRAVLALVACGLVFGLISGLVSGPANSDTVPKKAVSKQAVPKQAESDLLGETQTYTTVADDTLMKVAASHRLGLVALVAANPRLDPWYPGLNKNVVLPTVHLLPPGPRQGIVINLPEQRLYHFMPDGQATSYPVAMGRGVCDLAPGETKVAHRRRHPSWRPSIKLRAVRPDLPALVPPGQRNPLGKYALDLTIKGALIHGSPRPFTDHSELAPGCILLYPDHMAALYGASRKGTTVTIIDQPIKFGWAEGELYLEVHLSLEHGKSINTLRRRSRNRAPKLLARLEDVAGVDADRIDRALVRATVRAGTGVPVKITRPRSVPKVKKVRGLFGG